MQRVKIDVYLTPENKKEIQKKAKKVGLSVSDYMWLKALDMLKEKGVKNEK
jgi:hypothetical protein